MIWNRRAAAIGSAVWAYVVNERQYDHAEQHDERSRISTAWTCFVILMRTNDDAVQVQQYVRARRVGRRLWSAAECCVWRQRTARFN
jgi:hypothetical protein